MCVFVCVRYFFSARERFLAVFDTVLLEKEQKIGDIIIFTL